MPRAQHVPPSLALLRGAGLVGGPDRVLDPGAQLVAEELRRRGMTVVPVRPSIIEGMATPDVVVDGRPLEIKTLREPSLNAVAQATRRGRTQARWVVVDGREAAPPIHVARAGLAEAVRKYGADLDAVLILLPDGDLHWP